MKMICPQCGKSSVTEEGLFCPFCGSRLEPEEKKDSVSAEEKRWLEKADQTQNVIEREKILLKAREACPDSYPIEWELLFIGHERKERNRVDYSRIKCYLLHMYFEPEIFSSARMEENRQELFGDPQLQKCLKMSGTPDQTLSEYLLRLSREYIDIFLAHDARINRTFLGFHVERNLDKTLSRVGANMLIRIRDDELLSTEHRGQLYCAFYQAMSEQLGGRTSQLDEEIRIR